MVGLNPSTLHVSFHAVPVLWNPARVNLLFAKILGVLMNLVVDTVFVWALTPLGTPGATGSSPALSIKRCEMIKSYPLCLRLTPACNHVTTSAPNSSTLVSHGVHLEKLNIENIFFIYNHICCYLPIERDQEGIMFQSHKMLSKRRFLREPSIAILMLSFCLSGCGGIKIIIGNPETQTPTINSNPVNNTQPETDTSTPTTETITVESSTQVRPLLPANQLSQIGAWLVYATSRGIMASNPDGSGSVQVSSQMATAFSSKISDIPNGISPLGTMFAHRIDHVGGKGWDLEIIEFPSLGHEIITPLISAENLIKMATDITTDQNIGSAVIYDGSISWSPDGRYLAFSGALDGPSSDLYIYDSVAKKVKRLTSGSLEVAIPRWSSDGKEIIYQVVETFGTGAGWSTRGLWAINVDGSEDHQIFSVPENSGPDTITGFYDNKMLVRHFTMHGDSLYLVDWKTGDTNMLIPDVISAAIEPINGSYLFLNSTGTLYFSPNTKTTFGPISSKLFTGGGVYWADIPGRFIVVAEGVEEVDQFGNVSILPGIPYAADDWASNCIVSINIDCSTPSGNFTISGVQNPILYWVFDASGFFYLTGSQLKYVSIFDRTPVIIDEGILSPREIGWLIMPG